VHQHLVQDGIGILQIDFIESVFANVSADEQTVTHGFKAGDFHGVGVQGLPHRVDKVDAFLVGSGGLGGEIDSIGNINEKLKAQKELWSYAKNSLQSTGFVTINSTDDSLPYILNISVEGYRSETLLHFLEAQGIYVSSGSACAKGEGSYVLKEIGLSKNRIDSALRISFSRDNTKEDVDTLKNALISATQKLRRSIK
jgi:cysteine desulfurase